GGRGNSSAVERQPSKLGGAGSNPVSRSTRSSASSRREHARVGSRAHVAQSAERVLGKDEVSGSSPDMGSIFTVTKSSCDMFRRSSAGFAVAISGLLASDARGPARGRPAARIESGGELRKGGEAPLRVNGSVAEEVS